MIKAVLQKAARIALVIQDGSGTREIVVTKIVIMKVAPKAPSNFESELTFRNSPYGIRSTLICIANIISAKTIAVAPSNAPPNVSSNA